MNIYQFSEMWHRDGLEPSLCFFLRETDEEVRLTFPAWKNKTLQNILRYVENQNESGNFNSFAVQKLLKTPDIISKEPRKECKCIYKPDAVCLKVRKIPTAIYHYLLDNHLATQLPPKPMTIRWIDFNRMISDEDIYKELPRNNLIVFQQFISESYNLSIIK